MGTHVSILHFLEQKNADLYLSEFAASVHIIRVSLSQEFGNLYLIISFLLGTLSLKQFACQIKKWINIFLKTYIHRSKSLLFYLFTIVLFPFKEKMFFLYFQIDIIFLI